MAYNLTNMTDGMNPLNIIVGINQESTGLFGIVLLITTMLVIAIMVYSRTQDMKNSLIITSFATTLISLLMWSFGIIAFHLLLIPIVFLVFGLIFSKLVQ